MSEVLEIKLEKSYRFSYDAFDKIVQVQNQIFSCNNKEIVVNIIDTTYITPAFIVLIATFPGLRGHLDKKVVLRYDKKNKRMVNTLKKQGVFQYYQMSGYKTDSSTIPLCKITSLPQSQKLVKRILDVAPVKLSDKAKDTIFSKLYEVFINAETHGKNDIGTFCHGTFNAHNKKFVFSIYDFGIGIQASVNNYLKQNLTTLKAMKWALMEGNSTLVSDYPRGAGFTLLERFAKLNNGEIWICSDDVICCMKMGKRNYYHLKYRIEGTLFIMNIQTDNEYTYIMKTEEQR